MLLCTGPLILLAIFLSISNVIDKLEDRDRMAENLLNSFANTIDHDLHARISALHMLAESSLVDDPARWKDLYQEAQGFYKGFGSHVILADLEMHMLFNTRVPFGTKLPVLPRPKGHSAVSTVLETGKPAVGDIFLGPIAKEPLIAIAAPAQRKGKTAFLLLTIFETRKFQARIDQIPLPPAWSLALLDSKEEIIVHHKPQSEINTGKQLTVKSKVSPWSMVIGIPYYASSQTFITTVLALAIAIISVILVSLIGGMLVSRRLRTSIASLTEPSIPGAPLTEIAEIASVRRLLDKTEAARKQFEAELQDSEERYRSFFQQSIDAVLLTAPDGSVFDANPEACRIFGRTVEELRQLGRKAVVDFTDPRLAPALEERAHSGRFRGELSFIRKDGSTFPGELSSAIFNDSDGNLRTIMIIRDITERKIAEQTLRDNENRLRLLIEHAPAAMAIFDREMRYIAASRRWRIDYFLGDRDLYGLSHYDIFPEITNDWKDVHRRAMAGEIISREDDRFERTGGQVQWLRWEVRPWFTADENIGGIVVFSEEVTARKKAEEALRESEERYRNILMVAPVGIAVHQDGKIVFTNPAGLYLLGAESHDQIIGKNITEIIHPDSLENASVRIQRLMAGEQGLYPCEDKYIRLDGKTIDVEVVATKLTYNNKPAIQVIVTDITERRQAEAELLKYKDHLEELVQKRTNELAEANLRLQELDRLKSMFIASMSHELRTPLNSIIGFTGIILMGMSGPLPEVQRKQLSMVKSSANHLLDLINDVIDISKIEAGKTDLNIEDFNLSSLITEVNDSFAVNAAAKGLVLEFQPEGNVTLKSDQRRVRQILANLISNAVKFTERGGVSIAINTAYPPSRSEILTTGQNAPASARDAVQITVRDTGIGITPQDMEKLFEAFSRIYIQNRPVVEGTGLGLYLSQKIATLLGGEIMVKSEPGNGSEFTLYLPWEYPGEKQ